MDAPHVVEFIDPAKTYPAGTRFSLAFHDEEHLCTNRLETTDLAGAVAWADEQSWLRNWPIRTDALIPVVSYVTAEAA